MTESTFHSQSRSGKPNEGMGLLRFSFEGRPIRVSDQNGVPWFVLTDVCRLLEIGNPSDVARSLDDDEKHTLDNIEGMADRRVQALVIVSESGLYSLIFRSRKPEAKRFRKWVTSEVLPSIRKTGGYGTTAEVVIAVVKEILPSLVHHLVEAKLGTDRRIAVREFRSTLEILRDRGVPQRGRRGLVGKASASLRAYCASRNSIPRRCARTDTWLYPVEILEGWWRDRGAALVREFLADKDSQPELKLVVRNTKKPA